MLKSILGWVTLWCRPRPTTSCTVRESKPGPSINSCFFLWQFTSTADALLPSVVVAVTSSSSFIIFCTERLKDKTPAGTEAFFPTGFWCNGTSTVTGIRANRWFAWIRPSWLSFSTPWPMSLSPKTLSFHTSTSTSGSATVSVMSRSSPLRSMFQLSWGPQWHALPPLLMVLVLMICPWNLNRTYGSCVVGR